MTNRISGVTTAATAAALCFFAGAPAALAQATIAEIAPERSVVVAGVDDFEQAKAAFERSGLMDLWNEPEIQQWFESVSQEALADMADSLNELGFTMDDLSAPSGPAGFALFLDGGAEDARETEYHFVAVADFGGDAQTMHELIIAGFEDEADNQMVTMSEEEYAGVTIITIEQLDAMEDDAEGEEDWGGEWEEDWDSQEPWTTMYYANPGSSLVVSSSLRQLEHAIDRIASGEQLETVDALSGWGVTKSMLGEGSHAYLVSVTEPWFELTAGIEEAQMNDGMMDVPPIMQIVGATGLGQVQGMGIAVNFDADGAVAEQRIAVAVPELEGLMSLIPTEAKAFNAPNFVSADATSFSMFQLDWSELFPAARQIINQLPPDVQQQAMQVLPMAQGIVGPLFESLGTEIYVVSEIKKPFTATSSQSLLALKAIDENSVRQTIGQLTQMAGLPLETRQFQGGTIWSMPAEMAGMMGGPMGGSMPALGLGAGHLFVGTPEAIESAMRTAGDAGAARLADDARFVQAAQGTKGSGLSYSWTDFQASLEYGQWFIENQDEIMREELRGMGMTDEEIEQQMQWMGGGGNPMLDMLPNLGILSDYIGDSVTTFDVTDRGIVGVSKTLKPE